jgi:hypothetical protein
VPAVIVSIGIGYICGGLTTMTVSRLPSRASNSLACNGSPAPALRLNDFASGKATGDAPGVSNSMTEVCSKCGKLACDDGGDIAGVGGHSS